MSVRINNLAKHLLTIPLNSGETVHLASGELSPPIEDFEIHGNDRVAKLLQANLIAIAKVESQETSAEAPEAGSKGSQKK